MHLNEITKSSDLVYQAKIFHVTKDTAELEDGKIVQRDVVHHSGGVCVVPLTERQTVLMVQQYRYPFHEVTLEIPAGKREPGEDPLECGLRELREEVGLNSVYECYLLVVDDVRVVAHTVGQRPQAFEYILVSVVYAYVVDVGCNLCIHNCF